MRSALNIFAICGSLVSTDPSPTHKEKNIADEHIRHIFPESTSIKRHSFHLSSDERDSLTKFFKQQWTGDGIEVLIPFANDTALGYAVIDDVKGKDQLITYLLIVTPAFAVRAVEILTYRESYGGEVQNSAWLKQFINKEPTDELRPGKEIRNITGATISARSVTLGVRKVLGLLHILKERLPRSAGGMH
jgi:Na+-translocating ferredoxin:NAD+ oxidoreductase RnfG subunit